MTSSSLPGPSNVPSDIGGTITTASAKHLYVTLLGRPPESPQRVAELAGTPLKPALTTFITSGEFAENLRDVTRDGVLPPRPAIPARDLDQAAAWLSDLTGIFSARAKPSWAGFLRDVLACEPLAAIVQDPDTIAPALEALDALLEAEAEMYGDMGRLLAFDPAWFAASAAGRAFSGTSEGLDTSQPVPRKTDLPSVMAFFTDGMDTLDGRDRPGSLGQLILAAQSAARQGDLHHWLWDPVVYRYNASRSDTLRTPPEPMTPYLEFLMLGDAADVAPHPLFSAFAYRRLNPDVEADQTRCFDHYVRHGCPDSLRTSALFDPDFYLSQQPHVRAEIASGRYGSALEHFIRVGLPAGYAFSPDFDQAHYLEHNPDIVTAVRDGSIPSAEWHFVMSGVREGRAPNRFFNAAYYLSRYPFVADEMVKHDIMSPLEHFLLLGRQRGYRVNHPPLEMRVEIDQAKALFEKRGRRAYGEALAGVFTFDAPPVKPGLSVVVPISGQADFTAGFLKCARWAADHLQYKRGVATEIVVVDNGSSDHTDLLLKALPGVKVVRFDTPIGFPAAVNAGAKASSGDVIIIANNDIEFQADAFLRIVDGLSADTSIGVLGAKVILPDETLQEVGSVLDKDGSSHGLGRGMAAAECLGARTFRVDYASGCFIGVRRADFNALNQLDEAYSPGYYEEVDFSIRMQRDLKKTTAVDTGLAIVHYEHASFAKGRPPSVSAALILKNRVRIRSDHAPTFAAIANRDPGARARQIQASMTGGARVLVIEDMIPSSLLGSGFCREEEILDIFTQAGIAFDVVALNPSPRVDDYKNPLARLYRAWMPGQHLEEVLRDHGHKYTHIWLCRTHNLTRAVGAILDVKASYGTKIVCDTEAIAALRLAEQMTLQGKPPTEATKQAMIAAELTDPIGVDLWIAVNPLDQAYIEQVGVGPVREIGHAVTFKGDPQTARTFGERSRVTFIGAVHELASPNYDSLNWYLSQVAPHLGEDIVLTVAGFWGTGLDAAFKAAFKDARIDFRGGVSQAELAQLYAESRLTIAPTRFAGGIPFKVMESVMAGVPVVMTDNLAAQFGLAPDPAFASAPTDDDGAAFARWVETLYRDEAAWQAQRKLQARTIGENSSTARLKAQVLDAARQVGMLK